MASGNPKQTDWNTIKNLSKKTVIKEKNCSKNERGSRIPFDYCLNSTIRISMFFEHFAKLTLVQHGITKKGF